MQNLFGKFLALCLVGGGFAATGDLGWLAARGMRLLNATGVPEHDDEAPVPVPAFPSTPVTPGIPPIDRAPQPPAASAAERIEVAALRPGDRVHVRLADPATPAGRWLVLDMIDPASGAALLQDEAPRRVRILGDGTLSRGGQLELVPLGFARTGRIAPEARGTITALAVGD